MGSSSPASWEWRPAASTRPPTTPTWGATLTSGRTCTPTLSCPEAPPCTLVLLTACRRRSPPLPPPPSRSRSSLPLHLPADVDLQAGVRRVRPLHRPPQVLLNAQCFISICFIFNQ